MLGLHPVGVLGVERGFGLAALASLGVELAAIGVIAEMQLLEQVLGVGDILMSSCDGYSILLLHVRLLVLPLFLLLLLLQPLELLLHVVLRGLLLWFVGVADEVEVLPIILIVALVQPRLSLIVLVEVLGVDVGL